MRYLYMAVGFVVSVGAVLPVVGYWYYVVYGHYLLSLLGL
jgi:hypothetical protein